jgi:hypothetical protein
MADKKNDDLALLIERARQDPQLAAAMVADLDTVVRKSDLNIDPESTAYKDLAIQLYRTRITLSRTLDDFRNQNFDLGVVRNPIGGFYGTILDTDVTTTSPIELKQLKADIIKELRSEFKNK